MKELDTDGLATLSRFLDFASGQFDVAMVRADTPDARAALEQWLRERVESLGVYDFDMLGTNPLARLGEAESLGDVLLVTGLEGRTDNAFRALNVQRDSLMEVAPVPWILVGHQQGLTDLQQVAPDFCDMVSAHVTVAAGPDGPLRPRELAWMPYSTHSGVLSRLEEVQLEVSVGRGLELDSDEDTDEEALFERADELQRMGQLSDARALLDRWWIATRRAPGTDPRVMARGLRAVGAVMRAQGDLTGARRLLEQSLEFEVEADGGDDGRSVAATLYLLAAVLLAQGDLAQARRHLQRSLDIQAKVFGTEEHHDYGASLHVLAGVLHAQGDLDGARRHLQRSLDIYAKVFGTEEHPSVAASLHELGRVLNAQGDLDGAEQTYKRALALKARIYESRDHYSTCMTEVVFANLLLKRGQHERATALLQHAHPILLRVFGSANDWVRYAGDLLLLARAGRGAPASLHA